MQISLTAQYAVRAALDIALHTSGDSGTRAGDIAARTAIPERFLGTVLLQLVRAGLLTGRRGPGGGYRLAHPAHGIRLSQVIAAVEPNWLLEPGACGLGGRTATDAVHDLLLDLAGAVRVILDGTTLEEMRERSLASGAYDFCI